MYLSIFATGQENVKFGFILCDFSYPVDDTDGDWSVIVTIFLLSINCSPVFQLVSVNIMRLSRANNDIFWIHIMTAFAVFFLSRQFIIF